MPTIKRIAFDELLPDLPFTGETNGMAEAINVLPVDRRWFTVRNFKEVASGVSAVSGTLSNIGEAYGALFSSARDSVILGVKNKGFGGGITAALYEVDEGAGTISDISKAATYTAGVPDHAIDMCEFGDFFIAAWLAEPVQYIDSAGTEFADLFTSTLKPKAKFCCTSKVHLVIGYTNEGGTDFPRRIRWSAQGDPRDMDDGSARAGFVDVHAGNGSVVALAGFEDFFLAWTERKVLRFDYVGGVDVWHSVEIGSGPEAMMPGMVRSVVQRAGGALYRGRDGYKVAAPDGSIVDIGEDKIRSYVRSPTSEDELLIGAIDNNSGLVAWQGDFGFELSSPQGYVLVFNPSENRFAVLDGGTVLALGDSAVVSTYAPGGHGSDGLGNLIWLLEVVVGELPSTTIEIKAFRLTADTTAATLQKSRLVEPVPGERSEVLRVRPVIELEEGTGKTSPTVQVKIEGWNDLYKKTAAFTAVTLDTDTDLDKNGWLRKGLPLSAQRWEFTVIVPEVDSTSEYVPINLLGLDVEFDQFTEF